MEKITKNNSVAEGQIIVYTENKAGGRYFKEETVIVRVNEFMLNDSDLWAENITDKHLSEDWLGFEELCLGSPEGHPEDFREATEEEKKLVIN